MSKSKEVKPIPPAVLEQAALTLRVLAHPHRLRMVEVLMAHRHTVGELARVLALAPHAVSQHLNQMRAHGILESHREGRHVYYRIISPQARTVIQCIRKHGPTMQS